MSERPEDDGEGHWFDPVAFAERWLEDEWPNKCPYEFRRYMESYERWRKKNDE